MDHSCSYEQFCRYIPNNIIKPKSEDWGTCLCKTCLNPELKLICIKRLLPEVSFDLNETNIDNADNILIGVCANIFAKKFKSDIVYFVKHKERFRSQYRKIKEIKGIVSDPVNKSKLIRVDWSENVELFQTRQEKSYYYNRVSCSINAAVLYTPHETKGLGTISDAKSHMAPATWVSLNEMMQFIDLYQIFILKCSLMT